MHVLWVGKGGEGALLYTPMYTLQLQDEFEKEKKHIAKAHQIDLRLVGAWLLMTFVLPYMVRTNLSCASNQQERHERETKILQEKHSKEVHTHTHTHTHTHHKLTHCFYF